MGAVCLKFAVGLSLHDTSFVDALIKNKKHIYEVYFSWGGFPNGRSSLENGERTLYERQNEQVSALNKLSCEGIALNILFNANCYGRDSQSRSFFEKIGAALDYISQNFNLSSVTTTSPLIAKFVKNNFSNLATRASVNMEIGTIQGMDYLAPYFDGYYMKREFNRDFDTIKKLKNWCGENGKTLHILANSGCLNNCSAHIFHDNLVAHEDEISKMDNCYEFSGICHEYLKNKEKRLSLVRDTNFIRPEDLHLYEPFFDSVKLATRVSDKPLHILESYINEKCTGNILEILEPNHAGRIYPYVIDNQKLKNDYLYCGYDCSKCSKCEENYKNALINLEEMY